MEPVTRRTVLVLGAVGAAAAVTGAGAFLWSQVDGGGPSAPDAVPPSEPRAPSAGDLREPEVLTSSQGRLELTLTADFVTMLSFIAQVLDTNQTACFLANVFPALGGELPAALFVLHDQLGPNQETFRDFGYCP